MVTKAVKAGLVAAAVALGAYWYFSPFWAIHEMQVAARAHDADAFNAHVDYPSLRESLKGQFSSMLAGNAAEAAGTGNGLKAFGAALGSMLGMAVADRFVDALVQPETVMRAMAQAQLQPDPRQAPPDAQPAAQPGAGAQPKHGGKLAWSYERQGADRVVAYGRHEGEAPAQALGLVFERRGFADWKLTQIRLPDHGA